VATNSATSLSTNSTSAWVTNTVIACDTQEDVYISIQGKVHPDGGGSPQDNNAGILTLKLARGDGSAYETTPSLNVSCVFVTTNTLYSFGTNLTVGATPKLKLAAIWWGGTNTYVTNLAMQYWRKAKETTK
jgi:hypothetical protein